jgi:hypothetical protein
MPTMTQAEKNSIANRLLNSNNLSDLTDVIVALQILRIPTGLFRFFKSRRFGTRQNSAAFY